MEIRCATHDEAVALEALQRRSSAVWDEYREQLAAHPDAIEPLDVGAIAAGGFRVAVDGAGALLGFSAVLAADADGVVELDGLFVEPEAMRRGVGRALVEDVVARARAGGATAIEVIGGPETRRFYEGCGFVAVADAPTRFGPATRRRRVL
ncbi:MAG TPA: GNAT family N-acetyltransferase [Baekduia sp.]